MAKIVVTSGKTDEAGVEAMKKRIADELKVCPEDIIHLPPSITVSVVEIPEELIAAREKKDAEEKKEAEKKAAAEAHGDDLEHQTVADLKEVAAKEEVELHSDMHKADILKAIRAKRKAQSVVEVP